MKQSLKDLARAAAIPLEKVQGLIDMCGGDEAWIESVLRGASKSEKAAMLAGVAYKAADTAGGLSFDDYARQRFEKTVAEAEAQLRAQYLSSKAAPDDNDGGDAGGELDPLDQAYVQLRDALEAGDPDGVQQALGQLAELAQSPPPPAAPMDVKARILTDSGAQSVMSSASKAAADPWMTWFAGGSAAATKAFNPKTDIWATALGADQRGK